MRLLTSFALFGLWLLLFGNLRAQDGTPDPFTLTGIPNGTIHALLPQRDGRTIVVGDFTAIGSMPCNRIARINLDGSIDASFAAGSGANGPIYAIVADTIGTNIYIGGDFTSYNGVPINRIACLTKEGAFSSSWAVNVGRGTDGPVYALGLSVSNNLLIVGGDFSQINGTSRQRLAALQPSSGSISTSLATAAVNAPIRCLLVDDVSVFAGGDFTSAEGAQRNRLAQFSLLSNSNTLLPFNASGGPDGPVYTLAAYPGLDIFYVGGAFTQLGTIARSGLAAFNRTTGALVSTFTPQTDGLVRTLLAPSANQLWVGGEFTSLANQPSPHLGLLNRETSWTLAPNPVGGTDATVTALAGTYDAKIMLSGTFNSVAGGVRPVLARLYGASGANPPATPSAPLVGAETDTTLTTLYPGGILNALGYKIDRSPDGLDNWSEIASESNSSSHTDSALSPGTTYFYRFRAYNSNGAGSPSSPTAGQTFARRWTRAAALDEAFNAELGGGVSSYVQTTIPLADGKTLIAGSFANVAGQSRKNIARLLANGAVDPAFDPGTGPNLVIYTVANQPDGKILIAGSFTSVAGIGRSRIARLNADGSLDLAFDPGTGVNSTVRDLALQPDGGILIAGTFSTVGGVSRNGIARLLSNGALDHSFDPGTGLSSIRNGYRLALQPDGKVVVAGFFQKANGVTRGNLARFHPDGSLDTAFATGAGANSWIESVRLLPDGKLIICGPFATYDTFTCNGIARLNADGSPDLSFNPGSGIGPIWANDVIAQPDGKIIAGGAFNRVQGKVRLGLARFHSNGALDESFQPGQGSTSIYSLSLLPDGKCLVCGTFQSLGSGSPRGIARLLGDSGNSVPPAPAPLAAVPLSSSQVRLDWGAVSWISGYRIERSSDGINWADSADLEPSLVSYSVGALNAGSGYFFRVRALNTNGPSAPSEIVSALTYTDYGQWNLDHGLAFDAPFSADADADGLSNLLEYALGSDPASSASVARPTCALTAGDDRLALSYVRARSDVDYRVESSVDLTNWSDAEVEQGQPGPIVTASVPINGGRKFLRLVVTLR